MREFQDGDRIVCTLLNRGERAIGTFLELHDAKDELVNWPNHDKARLTFRIYDFAMLHEFLYFIARLNGFRLSLRSGKNIPDTKKVFVLHKIVAP